MCITNNCSCSSHYSRRIPLGIRTTTPPFNHFNSHYDLFAVMIPHRSRTTAQHSLDYSLQFIIRQASDLFHFPHLTYYIDSQELKYDDTSMSNGEQLHQTQTVRDRCKIAGKHQQSKHDHQQPNDDVKVLEDVLMFPNPQHKPIRK